MNLPFLYTFRRCPYAIRARLALHFALIDFTQQEVSLNQKPERLLQLNKNGTVPVLELPDGTVLIESLDIMRWALAHSSQQSNELLTPESDEVRALIQWNDTEFKQALDQYKYADRYPEYNLQDYQHNIKMMLEKLDTRLQASTFLDGNLPSLADLALIPFVRQCAAVDLPWFNALPFKQLQQWRAYWLATPLFEQVMRKY